ncbi:hypothetical protein B9Z55_012882 [Caenorhabditis nigoni]|uniref:Uncharacterized protein n=1 Tax=Caenorhabditis nigoni TaxID=1611254 RepID=A0A2G5TZ86_9PELO|nr:hypothetical protein B9Z55_012882 [Caenorhabditis nigoni]
MNLNKPDQTRQELNDAFKREFDKFCSSEARIKSYDRVAETLPFWSTLTEEQKDILINTNPQTLRTPLGWKFKDGKFVTELQKTSFLEEKEKLEGLVRQEFLNSIDLDLKETLEKYKTSFEKKIPEREDWVHEYFQREQIGQKEVPMENDRVNENSEKAINTPQTFYCNQLTVSSCHNEELTSILDNRSGVGGGNEHLTGSSDVVDNTSTPSTSPTGPSKSPESQDDLIESSASSYAFQNSNREEEANDLMGYISSPSSTHGTSSPGPSENLESSEEVREFSPCEVSPTVNLINSVAPSLPCAILPEFDISSSLSCTVPPMVDNCSDQCTKTLCPPSSFPTIPSPISKSSNFLTPKMEPSTSSSNPPEVTLVNSLNREASPQNKNKRGRPRIQLEEPTTVRCEVDENLEEEEPDEILILPKVELHSPGALESSHPTSTKKNSTQNSSVTLETDCLASTNSTRDSLESNCLVEDVSNDSDSVVDENLDDSDIEEIEISFSPIGSPRAVSNEDDSGVFDGISIDGGSMEDGPSVPSAVEISSNDLVELDVRIEDGDQTLNDYDPGNLKLPACQSDAHEDPILLPATIENEGEVLNRKIDCFKDVMSSNEVHKAFSGREVCCVYDLDSFTDSEKDGTVALPNAFVREEWSEFMASEEGRILKEKTPDEPDKITFCRAHFHRRCQDFRIFHSSKLRLPVDLKFRQLANLNTRIAAPSKAQTTQTSLSCPSSSTPDEWHIESQAKDIRSFLEGLGTWNMDTLRAIEKRRKRKYRKLLKTVLNEDFGKEDFSKYAKVYEQEMEMIPFLFSGNWENSQSEKLAEERSIIQIQSRQSFEKMRRLELNKIWTEQFAAYRINYDLEHFKISMSSNEFRSYAEPWEADKVAFVANFQGYVELILRFHFPETIEEEVEHLVQNFSIAVANLKRNLKRELIERKWMPKISENEEKLLRKAYYRNWDNPEGFRIATMSVETCSAMIEHYFDSQRNGLESFEVCLQNILKRNPKLIKVLPWVINDPKPETSKRLQPHRAAKTWADKELPDITEYPPIRIIGNGVNYEDSGGIPLFGGVLGGDKEPKKEENGREVSTFLSFFGFLE